jgi:acyl-CoA hydrolase
MSATDASPTPHDDRGGDAPSAATAAAGPHRVGPHPHAAPPGTPRIVDVEHPRRADWVVTVDAVFPHHANTHGTLFGGRAMELMDVNAAIACYRYSRTAVVTASAEPIDFRNPVYVGEILEVRSKVVWTGRTSMIVRCEVHGENPLTGERRLCTIGHLNFVALGADGAPTPVPPLLVESDEDRRHHAIGARVREDILRRRHRHDPLPDEPQEDA